jgi:hypothetical protein
MRKIPFKGTLNKKTVHKITIMNSFFIKYYSYYSRTGTPFETVEIEATVYISFL